MLIVLSATRIGGAVVTANQRHFLTWVRLAQRAGLNVSVETALS